MDSHFISRAFKRYFQVVPASSEELKEQVFRLRYTVYCKELEWEEASRFPDELERDSFDTSSFHCLLQHRATGKYAGTVRLVTANLEDPANLFPFEIACKDHLNTAIVDPASIDRGSFGEISRLAVLSDFRRRSGEKAVAEGVIPELKNPSDEERRTFPHIALGLYLAAAAMGLLQGLDSVFVMMEPKLARRLRHYGMVFQQVGDIVNYHGLRGPFRITRQDLFAHMSDQIRHLMEVIQNDLEVGARRRGARQL